MKLRILRGGEFIFTTTPEYNFEEGDRIDRFAELRDIEGRDIYEHDRLRFHRSPTDEKRIHSAIWDGTVEFEDGVFTVSTLNVECIENSKAWKCDHDWTNSRWWGTTVGYGEYGTWNVPRRPLTEIHTGFGNEFKDHLKPLYEKFGYSPRIINVTLQGENKR